MILLLLNSALRSFLFGVLVWAVLKSLRMRDSAAETIIWTAVLVVALSMPLLNHYLPSLNITVPYIHEQPKDPLHHLAEVDQPSLRLLWVADDGRVWLLGAYALGLLACLTRLLIGLLQSLRLYLRAVPVDPDWAGGHDVRVSTALKSPASLARVILVPADYSDWSAAKREAVLAHEGTHVTRGDFFVQLAASFHCVVFWFSPFAWWLRSKLSEVAETASDEVAVERLDDRITYAEILLEVACGAQQFLATVAMAKGPFIQQRIERVLLGTRNRNLSAPLQALLVGSLLLAAFVVASTTTAIARAPTISPVESASPLKAPAKAYGSSSWSRPAHGTHHARRSREYTRAAAPQTRKAGAIAQREQPKVPYNPKALLQVDYAPVRPYVTSTVVHDGRTFYIFSTERPVIEVSAADRTYPQDH